ncbi:exonuclease SbcCD subunit D [soil metagenome]
MSETLRFVHAADLHLDSPFQGIKNTAPEHIASELREATFRAYDGIIDLCIERGVQALLIAGDVFDSADRSLNAQLRFIQGLERLHVSGIQSFVCHGNHDPMDGWTARLAFPESCHRFGPEIGAAPLGPDGQATVYGISYPQRNVVHDLTPDFQRRANDGFAIGLLHANVGLTAHESYAPCSLESLTRTGIDYWALGHVHNRAILNRSNPAVVYPGNTQGRHPNETGARGVYVVDVDTNDHPAIDFVPVSTVRWETAGICISELHTEQDLIDSLANVAEGLLHNSDRCSVVCRVELTGRGPQHTTLRRAGTLDALRSEINNHLSARSPFLWCERIVDRTGPEIDRAERRQAEDFLGDVLKMIDELQADPEERAEFIQTALEPLYSHSRARQYFEGHDPDAAGLLANAENRILARMLEIA